MHTVTISLPESVVVESRGARCVVDVTALSADIVARLVEHGLTQKVADSAAPALADAGFKGVKFGDLSDAEKEKVRDIATSSMGGVRDQLLRGVWTERKAADGVDRETVVMRSEIRGLVADAVGKAAWKAMEEAARVAAIDSAIMNMDESDRDNLRLVAQERISAEDAAKARAAALIGKGKIAIRI